MLAATKKKWVSFRFWLSSLSRLPRSGYWVSVFVCTGAFMGVMRLSFRKIGANDRGRVDVFRATRGERTRRRATVRLFDRFPRVS